MENDIKSLKLKMASKTFKSIQTKDQIKDDLYVIAIK
jgi:hypothetical protein